MSGMVCRVEGALLGEGRNYWLRPQMMNLEVHNNNDKKNVNYILYYKHIIIVIICNTVRRQPARKGVTCTTPIPMKLGRCVKHK